MKKIIIINGPNLNLLGKREPEVYGSLTFSEFLETIRDKYRNVQIEYFQSNIEGELIDKIQEVGFSYDGIVLNAAAYTHTFIGIGDAIKAIETPVIEPKIESDPGLPLKLTAAPPVVPPAPPSPTITVYPEPPVVKTKLVPPTLVNKPPAPPPPEPPLK